MSPNDFEWAVRAQIYRTFGERGSAPALGELATAIGGTEQQARSALQSLFDAHEIAPLPNGDGVWMAHPFSGVPTDFVVETPHMTCYANCAWDALGVPAIVGTDGWTRTHCAQSGEALEFGIRDGKLGGDEGVIHLLTPFRHAWDDIGFT